MHEVISDLLSSLSTVLRQVSVYPVAHVASIIDRHYYSSENSQWGSKDNNVCYVGNQDVGGLSIVLENESRLSRKADKQGN